MTARPKPREPGVWLAVNWEELAGALADAAEYRDPQGECGGCLDDDGGGPGIRCEDHTEDAARIAIYDRLAAELTCAGHDPRLWFPTTATAGDTAQRICGSCPVRLDCLTFGWAEEFGIWGGWPAGARKQHRRRTGKAAS